MYYSRFIWLLFFSWATFMHDGITQYIVINEIMADNESSLQDEDGDFTDWIEIYNPNSESLNLIGYHLTDDKDNFQKWTFPSVEIASKNFLIIYASKKDKHSENYIHTNFKISDEGEKLILSNSLEIKIDEFDKVELKKDESFGRLPDGGTHKVLLPIPTPGSSNNVINKLIFSHQPGFYNSDIELSMHSLLGDSVYYTIDGSEPSNSSNLYSSKIALSDRSDQPNIWCEIPTTPPQGLISNPAWQSPGHSVDKANIIRCASFKNGIQTSETYSQTYLIAEKVFQKYDMPVISLITAGDNFFDHKNGIYIPGAMYDIDEPEWSGNYFLDEIESERPIHIELFHKDGSLGFSQDAGVRIHGGKTRHASQKSLKLYARNEYGDKFFRYPLMPQNGVDKYKRFVLQTTMAAWGGQTVIKDILAHEIVGDLDLEKMDYQPVIVFLNGEYWGIHHIRDRIDEEYLSYTTGIDKDSLEIDRIGNNHFFDLINYFKDNIPIDDKNLDYISSQMDIDGFIDYNIAEMFLKNYDWPANNTKHWRPKKEGGKWRWIFFDIDGGFNDYTYNMLEHNTNIDSSVNWPNNPKYTFFFRSLIENDIFLEKFLSRYKQLLENDFSPSVTKDKLYFLINQYKVEMPNHIKRWHFPGSYNSWLIDIENDLTEFLEKRPCAVYENIVDFFDLDDYEVDCNDFTNIAIDQPRLINLIAAPNPNQGAFSIININCDQLEINICIANPLGEVFYRENNIMLQNLGYHTIDQPQLQAGLYFLTIQSREYKNAIPILITNQ